MTEFNFCDTAAKYAAQYLEDKGYDVIGIHVQGMGDKTIEEIIEKGHFDGVLDFVAATVSTEMGAYGLKTVIVVDDDIDPWDIPRILYALAFDFS